MYIHTHVHTSALAMYSERMIVALACIFAHLPAETRCADGNSDSNVVKPVSSSTSPNKKSQKPGLRCPAVEDIPFDFFPLPCTTNADCRLMGTDYLCCGREGKILRCTKGTKNSKPKKANLRITLPVVVESAPNITSIIISTTTTTPKPTTTTTLKPTTTITTTMTTPKPPTTTTIKPTTSTKADDIICPKPQDFPFQFIYIRCVKKHSECRKSLGPDFLCCNQRCVRGITAPATEQEHQPILGIIPRECPSESFGELLFEVQPCETDAECWPRVCCPDGSQRYCKTAMPRFDLVPATRNFNFPLNAVANYLQCTSPPSKAFDLFPKPCNNSLDCFPNLCCQEAGSKYCRPAKKSLLALIAGISQANRITP